MNPMKWAHFYCEYNSFEYLLNFVRMQITEQMKFIVLAMYGECEIAAYIFR